MRGRAPAVATGPVVSVRLARERVFEAGDYLGRALADDPIVMAIVPIPSHRTRQALATASRHLVQYAERWGEVYTTEGRIDGLTIWLPPAPHRPVGLARGGAALLAALTAELEPGDTVRLVGIGMRLARARHRAISRPHWHLGTVVADPRRADTELVSEALIQPILARADAAGVACFTATARAQQVLFLVRHGFQAVRDDLLTPRGPRIWSLVREPMPAAASHPLHSDEVDRQAVVLGPGGDLSAGFHAELGEDAADGVAAVRSLMKRAAAAHRVMGWGP